MQAQFRQMTRNCSKRWPRRCVGRPGKSVLAKRCVVDAVILPRGLSEGELRSMAKKKKAGADKEVDRSGEADRGGADLLSHMENGYELQTDLLGADPVLRRLKGNEEIRPASANRGTVEALQKRGLIVSGKGRKPLTLVWRVRKGK